MSSRFPERTKFLYNLALDLATNPTHTTWLCPLLLLLDAVLTTAVILKVSYTEIDFSTYMSQTALYIRGERDYTAIKGPTGPLVYPAIHLYIYNALYWVTGGGQDVRTAQWIFEGVYLGALGVVMGAFRGAKAPPYLFPLLILSKRLHSIFVLRLFNDAFAVLFLYVAIFAFQRRMWTLGCIVFSMGVGVKISLLLAVPGVALVLGQSNNVVRAIRMVGIMGQVQVLIALPFLRANAKGYISRAFEFTRQFLFKWTVNWRFVGEETFLSRGFSLSLLAAHLGLLMLFVASRWIRPSGLSILGLVRRTFQPLPERAEHQISRRVTSNYVMTTILSSIAIGMLCARSLHYQFYTYVVWATPFLLWRSGLHPVLIYVVWAAQEWAWNVYPSTDASSMVVIGCLAVQVSGVWWGTRDDFADIRSPLEEFSDEHEHLE